MNDLSWLDASGAAIWTLVNRYTGRVGYRRGAKEIGLKSDPPAIDCSGWAAFLLSAGMKAANQVSAAPLFESDEIAAVHTWSDRMIEELERRSNWILAGDEIAPDTLPPYATIGLRQGGGAWATNRPRSRGITHVVQVVRRIDDGVRFVSEAQGWADPHGLRLTPLDAWLDTTRTHIKRGEAWAVNAFAKQVACPNAEGGEM
jgi:hypothetical protein